MDSILFGVSFGHKSIVWRLQFLKHPENGKKKNLSLVIFGVNEKLINRSSLTRLELTWDVVHHQ